ncbi:hypothetical protein [Streptomyces sp. NPDC006012]|uniref:hypothetical protein n=1 Tax=Streptomyces sp. NPDC006012 TaxID=3364739 RepID=UPI0036A1A026
MSRETDTPSSGPNGHGGAAYPSGTPPYGTPMAADGGPDAGRSATQPEERKTETTLTTRIRINIPGSRPIPPVVVRTPVAETDGPGTDGDPQPASAPPPPSPAEAPAEPAPAAQEKTSDWFAPRKSGPAKGGPGGGSGNAAQVPGGSAAGGTPATGPAAGAPGAPRPGGGGRPGGVVGAMSAPGATRPGGGAGKGAGLPGATGGPVAPGHGGGTGSFDVTEAFAAVPLGGGPRPGQDGPGEPRRDDLPYFVENGPGGAERNGSDRPHGQGGPGGSGGFTGPRQPAGPTSGPVTGDGPLVPPAVGGPSDQGDHGLAPGGPFGGPDGGGPAAPGALAGPGGPGVRPGAGVGAHPGPGGGLSDDTAILTPQKQVPEPPAPGYGAGVDNVSGHTVTSGIPVVQPGPGSPFAPGGSAEGPVPHTVPKLPEPVAQNVPRSQPKKKKGRSKLVLLGGVVVVLGAGVYGAGLLMNHSDVPKGTTVLGVDIGGGTRDNAVNKLDDTFGSRVGKPLKLSVDGRTVTLDPGNAGLQFDYQATVSAAAQSDYNPVSVIGTLFGQKREIQPVMPVDEEKLQAALKEVGGASGSVADGTIKFVSGKAVAVYGKPGKGIDAGQSAQSVEQAYRTLVETGTASPVTVPTTAQQPAVSKAEVDREMKEFAEPAMSQTVTVQTDAAHSVPLSPQNSLWKFLRVTAVNGKLVDKPDLTALQDLYGQTFDGVLITRANGAKTPVTPQDVYGALRTALTSKTNRVAVIDTDPK